MMDGLWHKCRLRIFVGVAQVTSKQSTFLWLQGQHRLALAAMGSNGIAVIELAIVLRQCTAILKLNATIFYIAHLHQFAIGGPEIRIPAIACQQQAIPRCNFYTLLFMYRERSRLRGSEGSLFATSITSYQHIGSGLTDSKSLMFIRRHAGCGSVEGYRMKKD